MTEYEIRILNKDRTTSEVVDQLHVDNNSAIRAARKLAKGRRFEVWLGLDCIYGTPKLYRIPENTIFHDW